MGCARMECDGAPIQVDGALSSSHGLRELLPQVLVLHLLFYRLDDLHSYAIASRQIKTSTSSLHLHSTRREQHAWQFEGLSNRSCGRAALFWAVLSSTRSHGDPREVRDPFEKSHISSHVS